MFFLDLDNREKSEPNSLKVIHKNAALDPTYLFQHLILKAFLQFWIHGAELS